MTVPLRFHWRLIQGGDLEKTIDPDRLSTAVARPELAAQIAFCREAEQSGIDSVLIDAGANQPDSIVLGMALAASTERLKFMIAHGPGLMSPTLFTQQINTFSTLAGGRVTLNMVPGFSTEQQTYGDAVGDDARYERLKEYLTICTRFWWETAAVNFKGRHYQIEDGRLKTGFCAPDRRAPEIYIAGESADARAAAAEFANCWLHSADTPENVAKDAKAVRATGIEVGLQLSCVIRPTRREAVKAARKFLGATCIAIVGTPEEVADEIQNFREAGISQFILHGWPKWEEMHIFCREVLPLVRKREQTAAGLSLRQDDLVSAWTGTNNGLGLETRI